MGMDVSSPDDLPVAYDTALARLTGKRGEDE
jgi:hypothetical protein